ncbi:MAG: SDR family oxidoreductase [Actinobacteria bacterium]|nr:SDR family oxidoreductase [Actinomycetota bacterium]
MGRLTDKVAVITGAGSGIGLAAAKRFAGEGASVLVVDRDEAAADRVAAAIGDAASPYAADVRRPEEVEDAMAAAAERFGGIDIVLANAAVWGTTSALDSYPDETFAEVLEVNVTGAFLTLKYAVPHMKTRGGGSIVITSSVTGMMGNPGNVAYSVSKTALIGLMRVAAVEYAAAGIRVNTVNPGPTETPFTRLLEQGISPERPAGAQALIQDGIPLKRYAAPEEVAELMLFLASDESGFCTGGIYMIDGGMHMA